MKSVLAFFLACLMLVGSLLPQNDLSELGKLPQLLQHYRYHHSVAGGGLSLGEFLIEHYGSGMATHFGCTFSARHQQDHQGLPLHGQHECSRHVAFVLLAALPAFWPRVVAGVSPRYRPVGRALYQDGPGTALLQPPRA